MMQARSAWSLLDSIGINIHTSEQSYYSDTALVERLLVGLGVRHIRGASHATLLDPARAAFIEDLATQFSIRSLFTIDPNEPVTPAYVQRVFAALPTAIEAWEGVNEQTGLINATTQQAMFTSAKADPSGLPVIAPSSNDPLVVHSVCDYACAHIYWSNRPPENGGYGATLFGQPYGSLAYNIAKARVSANRPVWVTETGYPDAIGDDVKAIYTLRSLLTMYAAGVRRQYIYELLSHDTTTVDGTLGLVRPDGTPKAAYVALQGFMARIADTYHVDTRDLDITLSTPDTALRSLAFRKQNGDVLLALWRPVQNVDPDHPAVVTSDADTEAGKSQVAVTTAVPTMRVVSWFWQGAWGGANIGRQTSSTHGVGSSPLFVEMIGL